MFTISIANISHLLDNMSCIAWLLGGGKVTKFQRLVLGALLGACGGGIDAAHAVDGVAIELGSGEEDAARGGFAVQWDWNRELVTVGDWFLGGFWEAFVLRQKLLLWP